MATYYVDPGGDDGDTGGSGDPFATIGHAADVATSPGDLIIASQFTFTPAAAATAVLLDSAGSAAAPITLQGTVVDTVVSDAAFGAPSGQEVTITSAGAALPAINSGDYIEIIVCRGGRTNLGSYRETGGSPTTSSITVTKQDGAPIALAAGSATIRQKTTIACDNIADGTYHSPVGIKLANNYVHVKDIRVTGIAQATASDLPIGVLLIDFGAGAEHCLLERVESDHHGGSGCQIGTYYAEGYNTVSNSDFHHNYDDKTDGENADGIDWHIAAGLTGLMEGCRSWSNVDDGIDCWASEGVLTFRNNWTWLNGYIPNTMTVSPSGDGDGFKFGLNTTGPQHVVAQNLAARNRLAGFSANGAVGPILLHNNTAISNGSSFQVILAYAHELRNNVSYDNPEDLDAAVDDQYNSWNSPPNIVLDAHDFVSLAFAGLDEVRRADGSLPIIPFGRLSLNSQALDQGVDVGLFYVRGAPDLGAWEMTTIEDHLALIDQRLTGSMTAKAGSLASGVATFDLSYGPLFELTVDGDWNDATPFAFDNPPAAGVYQKIQVYATFSGTHTYDLSGITWLNSEGAPTLADGDVFSFILTLKGSTLLSAIWAQIS